MFTTPERSRAPVSPRMADNPLTLFLKNAVIRPMTTAAQVPSGRALANEMVRAAVPVPGGPIIEFGPGTGAITDRLLDHGCRMDELILVEQNREFSRFLKRRYPSATILCQDANSAINTLRGAKAIGAISGMPVLNFPRRKAIRFVRGCLASLVVPNGCLAQFTYGYRSPVRLGKHTDIDARPSHRIWRNLWPAVVWSYRLPVAPSDAGFASGSIGLEPSASAQGIPS